MQRIGLAVVLIFSLVAPVTARAQQVKVYRIGVLSPFASSFGPGPSFEAFTLLAAKSISYVDPASGGASGIHFAKVLDRLGIANEMKSKTVFPKSGPVGVLVANGEAELGVQQIQELKSVTGIEIIGPLPGDLQDTIVFSAAIMASARDTEASRALVNFLRTPEATAVIKAKGMEPAIP
jgi:molybdate transport system substrate-binding protein